MIGFRRKGNEPEKILARVQKKDMDELLERFKHKYD